MKKPKVGKTYTFVRKRGDDFEYTDFTPYEDGSAGFVADGYMYVFECDPNAWQYALAHLAALGFIELSEARQMGLVSADWQPTHDT